MGGSQSAQTIEVAKKDGEAVADAGDTVASPPKTSHSGGALSARSAGGSVPVPLSARGTPITPLSARLREQREAAAATLAIPEKKAEEDPEHHEDRVHHLMRGPDSLHKVASPPPRAGRAQFGSKTTPRNGNTTPPPPRRGSITPPVPRISADLARRDECPEPTLSPNSCPGNVEVAKTSGRAPTRQRRPRALSANTPSYQSLRSLVSSTRRACDADLGSPERSLSTDAPTSDDSFRRKRATLDRSGTGSSDSSLEDVATRSPTDGGASPSKTSGGVKINKLALAVVNKNTELALSPKLQADIASLMTSRSATCRPPTPRRAATAQRLRAQRHLEEALSEDRGAEILRIALARASAAGAPSALIEKGRERLAFLGDVPEEEEPDSPPAPKSDFDGMTVDATLSMSSRWSSPQHRTTSTPNARVAALIAERHARRKEVAQLAAEARQAEEEAEMCKLSEREEYERMKQTKKLEVERRRTEARSALGSAADATALRRAVDAARRLHIPPEELASFEVDLWVAEASERALEDALKSEDPARIRAAVDGASGLKLLHNYTQRAEEAIKAAYTRADIRRKLNNTLAGLRAAANIETAAVVDSIRAKEPERFGGATPAEVDDERQRSAQARHDAAAAKVAKLSDELTQLVEEGKELGLNPEELEEFSTAARRECRRQASRYALRRKLDEVREVDLATLDLRDLMAERQKLRDVVNDAIAAGLPEDELQAADKDRQRIHNAVEERRGAVRVFCRIRPLSGAEMAAGETEAVRRTSAFTVHLDAPASKEGAPPPMADARRAAQAAISSPVKSKDGDSTPVSVSESGFSMAPTAPPGAFDGVWSPGTQDELFDSVRDLVQSAVDGFNVTVFAYGQTGSGKTYTMYGAPPEVKRRESDEIVEEGLCPRAANEVFAIVERNSSRFEYKVQLSMVELYRNNFIDLLCPKEKKELKVRNLPTGEVILEGLSEQDVFSPADVQKLVRAGVRERHSRDTSMNLQSSRSHVMFIMKVHSVSRQTRVRHMGKLLFIDLAGSERVKRSEVTGDGLREAIEINKSLSALGDVVSAIARGDRHVPYRNHELTQLLQDSLGGTAKTLTFVNLHPGACNREESAMSLQFAQRCKGVLNRPAARSTMPGASPASSRMERAQQKAGAEAEKAEKADKSEKSNAPSETQSSPRT